MLMRWSMMDFGSGPIQRFTFFLVREWLIRQACNTGMQVHPKGSIHISIFFIFIKRPRRDWLLAYHFNSSALMQLLCGIFVVSATSCLVRKNNNIVFGKCFISLKKTFLRVNLLKLGTLSVFIYSAY